MNKFCLLNLESKNGLLIESYATHPVSITNLHNCNLKYLLWACRSNCSTHTYSKFCAICFNICKF